MSVGAGDPALQPFHSQQTQSLIDDAIAPKDTRPQDGYRHAATQQRWDIIHGPIESYCTQSLAQQHGEEQRKGQLQRYRNEDVDERDLQRRQIALILREQAHVIVQADPARSREQIIAGKRVEQRG